MKHVWGFQSCDFIDGFLCLRMLRCSLSRMLRYNNNTYLVRCWCFPVAWHISPVDQYFLFIHYWDSGLWKASDGFFFISIVVFNIPVWCLERIKNKKKNFFAYLPDQFFVQVKVFFFFFPCHFFYKTSFSLLLLLLLLQILPLPLLSLFSSI